MGFLELLALLTALSGFGVDENPNAPTATDVLATAPARADFMLHVDFAAVVPNNYARLAQLPNHESLAKEPSARENLRAVIEQIEAGRGMLRGMLGIDPITDITSATMWINLPEAGKQNVLLVVRGNLSSGLLETAAGAAGAPTKKIGDAIAIEPEPGMLVAVSPRGELLAGTTAWVTPRLKKSWKRERASALTRGAATLLDAKPAFAAISAPSKRLVRQLSKELTADDDAFARDVFTGHTFFGLAVLHNGLEWTVTAREQSGYRRALRASEGVLDVMRSMHQGSRGVVRLALAALPSFAGADEALATITRYEDEILQLVLDNTGDGRFEATVDKDPAKRTVRVKAWGKDLKQVLPVAGLLPLLGGGAAFFLLSSGGGALPAALP